MSSLITLKNEIDSVEYKCRLRDTSVKQMSNNKRCAINKISNGLPGKLLNEIYVRIHAELCSEIGEFAKSIPNQR